MLGMLRYICFFTLRLCNFLDFYENLIDYSIDKWGETCYPWKLYENSIYIFTLFKIRINMQFVSIYRRIALKKDIC